VRKLLLIGALCLGTAGAINLSDYKREDLCLSNYPGLVIFNKVDNQISKPIDFSEQQLYEIKLKLRVPNITDNKNCKLAISFSAESISYNSNAYSNIYAKLILIDLKNVNAVNYIRIDNAYEASFLLNSKLDTDIQFRTYLLYDALITRLLLDLQPARP